MTAMSDLQVSVTAAGDLRTTELPRNAAGKV